MAKLVSFVFCAVDMKKEEIKALEEAYAKHEIPVVSNNSANRWTPDVPMVIPEINDSHLEVIAAQRSQHRNVRLDRAIGFNRNKASLGSEPFALSRNNLKMRIVYLRDDHRNVGRPSMRGIIRNNRDLRLSVSFLKRTRLILIQTYSAENEINEALYLIYLVR